MQLKDLGEKKLIARIIKPFFNPGNKKESVGDDCAVIPFGNSNVCVSTDRVPSDLVAFKIGLINYKELGYYLAVLNISDSAAAGAIPSSLLLNFAFPSDFLVRDLKLLLTGVKKACDKYNVKVVGGDLSDSKEMSLSATIIGFSKKPLFRCGINKNDFVFCTRYIGLAATAFKYFLVAKDQGLKLNASEERFLIKQFSDPNAEVSLSAKLSRIPLTVCCMDNTDGVGQSLKELSEINNVSMNLQTERLPIHPITFKVAKFLNEDVVDVALGPGADFQLIGTVSKRISKKQIDNLGIHIIGFAGEKSGVNLISQKNSKKLHVQGWNYYL